MYACFVLTDIASLSGPWVVRKGIVSRPALIGRKLENSYYTHDRYFELDINIGTSAFVTGLTQMSLSYAKLVTVDLAFLLEGKLNDTLPEFLLGIVRAIHPDLSKGVELE